MTLFGKLLVLFTVSISLMMMAFGLAVWTNSIDWYRPAKPPDDPGGELAQRDAEAKRLWSELQLAESAWRVNSAVLARDEGQRVQDRSWYQSELVHLKTGANQNRPCRAVVFLKGVPVPDQRNPGRPQMVNVNDQAGKPLQSLAFYNATDDQIHKDMLTVATKLKEAVEKDTQLTNELAGDPIKRTKGLRQRINDERVKRADVVAEQDFVRPLLINTVVESELILKRQKSLRARVGELEKEKVAGAGGN